MISRNLEEKMQDAIKRIFIRLYTDRTEEQTVEQTVIVDMFHDDNISKELVIECLDRLKEYGIIKIVEPTTEDRFRNSDPNFRKYKLDLSGIEEIIMAHLFRKKHK